MGRRKKPARIQAADGTVIHTDLEVAMEEPEQVRHLQLRTQTHDSLPREVAQFPNLEHLDVSKNSFAAFPGNHLEDPLPAVHTLSATHSCISEITAGIAAFAGLKRLDLSWNEFTTLPEEIGDLGHLRVLRLEKSPLQALPHSLGKLGHLESLELAGCEVGELPDTVGELSKLKHLDVTENSLAELPEQLCKAGKLQTLRAGGNELQSLPPAAGQWTNLVELDLSRNQLGGLPEAVMPGPEGGWRSLRILNLAYNSTLDPQEVLRLAGRLSELVELDLSGISMPPSAGFPTGLRRLVWRHGALESIPDGLFQLENLESLDLAFGKVGELPARIEALKKLRILDLTANELGRLPETLGDIEKLRTLKVGSNRIAQLPEAIGQLGNIEELDASFNEVRRLPDSIGNLSQLRVLNLENNTIESAEDVAGLERLNNLERLSLVGNPITLDAEACRRVRGWLTDCRCELSPGKALHRMFHEARQLLAADETGAARRKLESIATFEPDESGAAALEFSAHRARLDAQAMLKRIDEGGA